MDRTIALINVPIDLGAGRRGVDMGPSAVRYAGLRARLEKLGYGLREAGTIGVPGLDELPMPAPDEKLRYLDPIAGMARRLAETTRDAMAQGDIPLIVGGDHSLSLGSAAGAAAAMAARGVRMGILWIDAHGDFNTADSTPSGNIHGMSLAALCGLGDPRLTSVLGPAPAVLARNVVIVGARDLDDGERNLLRAAGAHVFTMNDLDRRGMADVMTEALRLAGDHTGGIHLSLDLDALDPANAPGVGTPVPGGLTYREAHLAMEMAHANGRLVSMDLVEVNPILDQHNHTAQVAVELACSALGEVIF